MTIKFLNLYNEVAAQPWSMFDPTAESDADFEPALVSTINKAIIDVWYSFPFSFRIKKYQLSTIPKQPIYPLPQGNILNPANIQDNLFAISLDSEYLEYNPTRNIDKKISKPREFSIEDENIILYPAPDKKYNLKIKYLSLAIGYNQLGDEIFCMEKADDYISIPEKYETVFKNAVIAKALIESIASVNDENYTAYRLQFDKAYKLLINVTNPVKKSKSVVF